jgi:hypothetical protein
MSLARQEHGEFYPILRSIETLDGVGTKTTVLRLVIEHLPQPGPDTSWEAIIDFRNDAETRRQYLALTHWINEMTHSSWTANEIEEEFEHLFAEYKKSLDRHRLKWKTSPLEILVAVGASLLPTGWNLLSNLVKLGSATVSLMEEEAKLPGKEIAYIYRVQQAFK